jgi:hypothetical protein
MEPDGRQWTKGAELMEPDRRQWTKGAELMEPDRRMLIDIGRKLMEIGRNCDGRQ